MALIIPVSQVECQKKSWKTSLKEAISDPGQLLSLLDLSPEQLDYELDLVNDFNLRVPLPFIKKMKQGDPNDPLLLQVISQAKENNIIAGYDDDPLLEQGSQQPGLLHKYHGRVLLVLASACAINCRYCFRRHFPYQGELASGKQLQASIDYIASTPSITEVILSGGDPLIVSDNYLKQLIEKLEQIPHLKRLRIHTRLPIVIPSRITPSLSQILSNNRLKTSMVLHINHPNEIDHVLATNLKPLVQTGIQLLNQSVLLKGINDDISILSKLSEKLFECNILPYYLHQLDKVKGAAHFSVDDSRAKKLFQAMRDSLPGYLVPRLAREEAGKHAKTLIF